MNDSKQKKRIVEVLKLDGVWDNMGAAQKRGATVVLTICAALLVISVITDSDPSKSKKINKNIKKTVLADSNTRSIGVDALGSRVKSNNSSIMAMKKTMDRLVLTIKEMKTRRGNDPAVTRELGILKNQLVNLTSKAKSLGWDMEDIKEGYYEVGDKKSNETLKVQGPRVSSPLKDIDADHSQNRWDVEDGLNSDPNHYFRTAPVRPASQAPSAGAPSLKNGAIAGGGLSIYVSNSASLSNQSEGQQKPILLPAGSILTGVLLNGIDAATGNGARNDPFPVLVRIQKEAILPNEFTADIAECFVTLAGYGDLSSERAMLRGEMLSCVTKGGDVIEVSLPAYAVGEDGKAGVRGRLVERTGSLIAKTALAGFAAGIAEAFDTSPVPVIQTSDVSSDKTYQDNFSSDAAQHGASSGASASLSRLSDYYMDMADQIFPVVEIDAGRKIDVILTSGIKLERASYKNRNKG